MSTDGVAVAHDGPTATGIRSLRRLLISVLAVAAVWGGGAPSPADAFESSPRGQQILVMSNHGFYGPSETIQIELGNAAYVPFCSEPEGTGDFLAVFTDVYLVPENTVADGVKLKDVRGENAHRTIGPLSPPGAVLIDQIIGFTQPAGSVPPGYYSIVFDECQDGIFNGTEDYWLHPGAAFVWPRNGEYPPLGESITALKVNSFYVASRWGALAKVLEVFDAKEKIAAAITCLLSRPPGLVGLTLCTVVGTLAAIWDAEKQKRRKAAGFANSKSEAITGWAANTARAYLSLANDPPDQNFMQLNPLSPGAPLDPESDDRLDGATAETGTSAANETAIGEALLHALERYQGAEGAGNGDWALRHARSIRQHAAVLMTQLAASDAALDRLSTAVHTSPDFDAEAARLDAMRAHILANGVTSDAVRAAKNLGASDADVAEAVSSLTALDYTDATTTNVDQTINEMKAANASMRSSLAETQTLIGETIATLAAHESVTDNAPEADAGGPYSGGEGSEISVSGAGSVAHGSAIASYEWDLDRDGEFEALSQMPGRVFVPPREGQYLIGLKVTNEDGIEDVDYAHVTVTDVNRRPSASSATPESPLDLDVGEAQMFSITASDPEGAALLYQWQVDFVDVPGATTASFSYTPTTAGPQFVRVIVSDGTFSGGPSIEEWDVVAHAPDADGDNWEANADCNDADPSVHPDRSELVGNGVDDDCDGTTPDEGSAPVADWKVDLGFAGQPTSFTDASTDPNGDIVSWSWDFGDGSETSTQRNPTHTYAAAGMYTVTLTVTDATNRTASVSDEVTVAPRPNGAPIAVVDSLTTAKNTSGSINVLLNDSDPDGDPFAVTAWTQGAHGFVTCNFAGSCSYTPETDYVGPDSFTYTIDDGNGGTAMGSVDVTVSDEPPANRAPVAVDDVLVTAVNEAKTVDVLRNDADPDGDPLTVTAWTNGDNGGGTVSCTESGLCTYTPPPDLAGSEEFTYTISDGRGGAATASVAVTVEAEPANRNPVAVDDVLATGRNASGTVDVLANDSDPDGDPISIFTWSWGAHGSVNCAGDECTFFPAFDFTGTDTFTYSIHDGRGGTATGTVSVTVLDTNRPPVAVDDTLMTRRETQGFVHVTANDSDPDFDALTVSIATQPEHGELFCADWGGCWYTPAAGFFGSDSFVYSVSDGHGGTKTATVSITVERNRLPIPVDDSLEAERNASASIDVLANDSDPDGDALSVVEASNGSNGTVACDPGGSCTYTPATGFVGTDFFSYMVLDGTETAVAGVHVVVRDRVAAIPDWVFRPGKNLSFPVTINDFTGLTHTCAWAFGDGATSNECDFDHTYAEVGTYEATLRVEFSSGLVRTQTIEVRIVADEDGGGGGGGGGNTGRGEVVESTDRTYTLDDDFDAGTLLNVNHDAPNNNELRLNTKATPFPFLYVANSARGTAVRIDIDTGEILGEFLTAPDGRARNPSRTTVDKLGNVYVTNRDESEFRTIGDETTHWGSFARIGLLIGGTRADADGTPNPDGGYVKPPFEYSTCVDRDGDGLIRTSNGLGDILGWTNDGDLDSDGGVETAVDECLINYTRVLGTNTRTVAIDSNNDAWIGGANNWHEKVDGDTGQRVPGTAINFGCGGYGGLIDGNDVLWSARYGNGLLRYDTKTGEGQCLGFAVGDYGLGIDPTTGHIWHTYLGGNTVVKINPEGIEAGRFPHGNENAQGVAVDSSGNVWVAHALFGATTVGHVRTDGTLVGNVALRGGNGPTGVAVDSNGRVWSANINTNSASRIDPEIGPVGGGGFPVGYNDLNVDLGLGAGPYNYSDMTGAVSVGAASPSGFWSIVQDGGAPGTPWTKISWNGLRPAGTEIEVEARAANTQVGLASEEFVVVTNGAALGLAGRFIEVRANLRTTEPDATPVLQDIRIASVVNEPPTAETAAVTTAEDTAKPLTLVATDPDGDALTYTIVSGPAHGTLSGSGASRTYTPDANYHGPDSFTFRASDGALSDEAVVSITVTPVNDPPVAGDDTAETDEDTPLSLSGATLRANDTDVDGDLLTVTAVSDPQHGAVVLVGTTVIFTPDPNYEGRASFVYTVSDGNGGTDSARVDVTVRPVDDAPTARDLTVETDEDTPVEITLLGDDPDGGEPLTFAVATGPAHGTLTGEGATLTYTPEPNYDGPDAFIYTASSGSLASAPATVSTTVRPVNDAPVATGASVTTPEDTPVALPFAGTDVDGDELTFEVVAGPSHGSVSGQTYTPDENYHGADAVTFQVSDGTLTDEAVVEIAVTPVNDAPVAADDTAETVRDVPVELTSAFLLANDSDVDGDELTITEVGAAEHGTVELLEGVVTYTPEAGFFGEDSFTYTVSDGSGGSDTASVAVTVRAVNQAPVATDATVETDEDVALDVTLAGADADGDELTFQIVSGPAHGSLSGTAPALTYTPDPNYNGSDSFTFRVSDGSLSDEAVVDITINPVNDAPDAVGDAVATEEDTALELPGADLRANDSDVDGDSLTISAVGTAAHGSVGLLEGVVTYTPAAGFSGEDSFTYTISDGNGGSDTATVAVTVRPVNDSPSADDLRVATDEDTAVELTLSASDPEGDPLTFAVTSGPAHGTVSSSGATRTYTPDADYHGPDSFTYTASDGALTSAEATMTITVRPVNDAPVADDAAVTTPEDTAVALVFAGTDVDRDELTFAVIGGPAHGTLVDGTYTPDPNYHGPDAVRFRASDGALSDEAVVSITVTPVNDPPVARDDEAETVRDTALELPASTLLANDSDVDGDELAVTAVGTAEHGSVGLAEGVVTYMPAAGYVGPDSFTYTVSDGSGGTATATISITVRALNRAPVAQDDSLETDEDVAQALTLVAADPDGDTLAYEIVSGPAHGTLSGAGAARTYTPDANYHGPDSVTFRASDGALSDEAVIAITVTPVNDRPVAVADAAATDEDVPLELPAADLRANDSDVDGDSLTVSAVSDVQHGTVGLAGGVVTFTPEAGYSGPASFVYTISDGNGGTDTATVSVTVRVVNDRPGASDLTVATDEDTAVGVTLAGSDSDNDALTFAVASGPAHGALTGTGATRTYTPDPDYHGPDSFTYTASDAALTSAPATVTITVRPVNDAPEARDDAFVTDEGRPLVIAAAELRANDSDVDGDALTITAVGTAEHGTVELDGDQVTYTPQAGYSGRDSFAYTVSDGNGGTANATVSITVRAFQPAAMALVIDDESIDKDTAPNFFSAIAVNDPIARVGLRATLPAFAGDNVGRKLVLHTGGVGNEGWFALRTIPASWATAGPTADGLRNFLLAGPGLGSGRNRQRLLESVPSVTPLRATGLKQLVGHSICAVVYDSDVSINYAPLTGSLKGANLGVVAAKVTSVTRLTDFSSSSLPKVEVEILDRERTCGGPLQLLASAPVPTSSSEPFDVTP